MPEYWFPFSIQADQAHPKPLDSQDKQITLPERTGVLQMFAFRSLSILQAEKVRPGRRGKEGVSVKLSWLNLSLDSPTKPEFVIQPHPFQDLWTELAGFCFPPHWPLPQLAVRKVALTSKLSLSRNST